MIIGSVVKTPSKLIGLVVDIQDNTLVAFDKNRGKLYSNIVLKNVIWDEVPNKEKIRINSIAQSHNINIIKDGSRTSSKLPS